MGPALSHTVTGMGGLHGRRHTRNYLCSFGAGLSHSTFYTFAVRAVNEVGASTPPCVRARSVREPLTFLLVVRRLAMAPTGAPQRPSARAALRRL